MGSAYQFHSWRVFVVVCALPCVCAVVALTFMPESPRFYLEVMAPERSNVKHGHDFTLLTECKEAAESTLPAEYIKYRHNPLN